MRKLKKILACVICMLFFINYNIFAMGTAVIQDTNYQDNRGGEELPEEADVEIENGSEIISSVKIPDIALTFEKVLYGHTDLIDIQFFDNNSGNQNDLWLTVRKLVNICYKGTLYMSFAVMLVFLIYMAVNQSRASFKTEDGNIELDVSKSKKKSVIKSLKFKVFFQEWVVGLLALAFLTLGINLMIYFSEFLLYSSPIGAESEDGLDNVRISVKVENANIPVRETAILGEVSEADEFNRYLFVGDSRVQAIKDVVGNQSGKDEYICKSGSTYRWLKERVVKGDIDKKIVPGTNLIIWMGTNDWEEWKTDGEYRGGPGPYIDLIRKYASKWSQEGATLTVGTIGITKISPGFSKNVIDGYKKFNAAIKQNLQYIARISDVFAYTESLGNDIFGANAAHYNSATSVKIYNFLKGKIVEDDDTPDAIESSEYITDFYFETNTEGLLVFLSQYKWSDYGSRNIFYIFCGIIVSICKYVILGVFFFRMLILALLIAIAPVLLLINIFKRINGVEGFLRKWIRLFMYLIFLRFLVYLVYYVLLKAVPDSIKTTPVYIIVMCLVLDILCIVSFFKVFKSLFKREKRIQR